MLSCNEKDKMIQFKRNSDETIFPKNNELYILNEGAKNIVVSNN